LKGDPKKPRKVIDYVVFERHLADPYGRWRICGKVNQPKTSTQKALTQTNPRNIVST